MIPTISLIFMVSCIYNPTPAPSLKEHFPQTINPPHAFLDMPLVEGKLIIENGCLRLSEVKGLLKGDSFLLIWDTRFSTITEEGVVSVIDSQTGEILVSVNDDVAVSNNSDVISALISPIPDECKPPYMVVGELIKKIDKP